MPVEPIVVSASVRVPARGLTVRAVRASGPGGQNVNKVATKVALHVDLSAIEGLDDAARQRLLDLAGGRMDARGQLVVTSQLTRTQARNLEDARERVRALVLAALVRPRTRRATRPSATARERRLSAKRGRGARKRLRTRPGDDD